MKVYIVQAKFVSQYGWEDVGWYADRKTAQSMLVDYRMAHGNVPHRIIAKEEDSE
jgi:hypothetical protein